MCYDVFIWDEFCGVYFWEEFQMVEGEVECWDEVF